MGLDTSHGCWHGAYSAFARWRKKLADIAGIPLDLMGGFCKWQIEESDVESLQGKVPWDRTGVAIRDVLRAAVGVVPISWDILKPDVLHVLLYHSDCDGEIPAEVCGPLADRLEEFLPSLPTEADFGHIGDWREKTQTFIDGLRLASSLGESVDFH